MSRLAPWIFTAALVSAVLACAPALATVEAWNVPKELGVHLLAGAVALSLAWQLPRGWDRIDVQAGLFAVVTLIACAVALNPWLAWRSAALTVSAAVLFVWAREHAWARGAAFAAATGVALSVCLEAAGVTLPSSMTEAPGGVLGSRTAAVLFLSVSGPAFGLFAAERSRTIRFALSPALVLQGLAAGLTHSALVALLGVGAVLGVTLLRAEARRAAVVWGVVPLLAGAAAGFALSPAEQVAASMGALGPWLPLVRERLLFGVGPGHWSTWAPRVSGAPFPGELGALLVERGFAGAAVAGMLGLTVVRTVQAMRARGEGTAAMAGVVFALFACGLLTTAPLSAATLALTALLLGASLPRMDMRPFRRGLLARTAGGVLAALLLVSAVRSSAQWLAMATARGRGASAEELRVAVSLDPGNVEYRLQLAEMLALQCECDAVRAQLDAVHRYAPWHWRSAGIEALCHEARCSRQP